MEDDNDDTLTFLPLAAATARVVESLTMAQQHAGKREAEQNEDCGKDLYEADGIYAVTSPRRRMNGTGGQQD